MTQASIANRLGVQATYLSRVLNDEKAQFSEDHLFRLLEAIGFDTAEREYLMLLRTYETTALRERRAELEARIREYQREPPASRLARLKAELAAVLAEIRDLKLF